MNHRERKERMEEVVDSEMADVFVFFALFVVGSTSANKTLETNADFASLRRHRSAFRWANKI